MCAVLSVGAAGRALVQSVGSQPLPPRWRAPVTGDINVSLIQ